MLTLRRRAKGMSRAEPRGSWRTGAPLTSPEHSGTRSIQREYTLKRRDAVGRANQASCFALAFLDCPCGRPAKLLVVTLFLDQQEGQPNPVFSKSCDWTFECRFIAAALLPAGKKCTGLPTVRWHPEPVQTLCLYLSANIPLAAEPPEKVRGE